MELKVTKAKVLEASEKCSTAKNIFKVLFPEVFEEEKPKYKKGDWVIGKDSTYLPYSPCRVSAATDRGVSYIDEFGGENGNANRFLRLATPEEIKEHLIAEAERRGYKAGVKVNRPSEYFEMNTGVVVLKTDNDYYYNHKTDRLEHGGLAIYNKGTWAEILHTKLKLTKEMIAEKFGKTVHEIEIE